MRQGKRLATCGSGHCGPSGSLNPVSRESLRGRVAAEIRNRRCASGVLGFGWVFSTISKAPTDVQMHVNWWRINRFDELRK
jgi:hypothetical protein